MTSELKASSDAEQVKLRECPFCHEPLTIRNSVNPYGRCDTEDCWLHDRKIVVPFNDKNQVAAWNTRPEASLAPAPGAGDAVDRAKIKRLWKEHGGSQHGPIVETYTIPEVKFWQFIQAALATLPRQTLDGDALREALKPFAEWADFIPDSAPDALVIRSTMHSPGGPYGIATAGDFRKARAVIRAGEGK